MSRAEIWLSGARISSRSTVLRSSRTLPGQSSELSLSSASGVKVRGGIPSRAESVEAKYCDQRRYVLAPLADRRNVNRDDVQPIVQILAELAARDLVLERLVRGGDHPNIHRDRLGAADPGDDVVLQHAQNLCLRVQAHVADLVEKQRSLVRLLELPGAVGNRSREGSLHVPEELALDQLTRDRGAIHLDERLGGAR